MPKKICIDCNKEKDLSDFAISFKGTEVNKTYGDKYKNRCKACYALRYRLQLKYDFLKALGCICSCCGETDFRLLTLDHINDDGNKHRELLKEHQILAEARKEGYPKDKYQVLCFNCNCGRSCNNGVCPHKDKLDKTVAWEFLKNKIETVGRKYVQVNTNNLPEARAKLAMNRTTSKVLNLTDDEKKQLIAMLKT